MSLIAWLDTSADDERRMRELVRMFSEPGTLDDLGIGQVRDALSDLMFPGISTVQTRARYFLFVPWSFQQAAHTSSGTALLTKARLSERRFIVTMQQSGGTDGLIGRVAGEQVTTLPSSIYWSALRRYGILREDRAPNQLRRLNIQRTGTEDDDAPPHDWNIAISPPARFPYDVDGGFDLTREEAEWLRERIVTTTQGTYLSHLLTASQPPDRSLPFWDQPSLPDASDQVQCVVCHADLFSLVMNGAALLYNLLVAEQYERLGYTAIAHPVDDFRERLDTWADDIDDAETELQDWDLSDLWQRVNSVRTTPVGGATQYFVKEWIDTIQDGQAEGAADAPALRGLVADRERYNKKQQARLSNPRLIATWSGSSGAAPLTFRWGQASRIITDIIDGLHRAGS